MPKSTVTPAVVYRDVPKAIDWLKKNLGFQESWRIEDKGVLHGALLTSEGGEIFVRPPRKV